MINKELEEIKYLAGLNEQSITQKQQKWADKQLNINKDNTINQLSQLDNYMVSNIKNKVCEVNSEKDIELENLANRLNKALGNNFNKDIVIERLQ